MHLCRGGGGQEWGRRRRKTDWAIFSSPSQYKSEIEKREIKKESKVFFKSKKDDKN
jgi:hypothetical protein